VLEELRVENLLLLESAQLRLAPGLNVLTGETGAGKTLLAHALDLLLGGKARRGIVRPGAAEAYVEGVFTLGSDPPASELIPPDAAELVLARRVWADGRTRAYVCGRAATQGDLRALGARLLSFYGQHEHRKLTLAGAQLEVLDSHCGSAQIGDRRLTAAAHARVRALEERLHHLRELAATQDRELDLLAFELAEIEAAAPSQAEQGDLLAERERLRHLEALQTAAGEATAALGGEEGGVGARLAAAARALERVAGVDPALAAGLDRLQTARLECEDIAAELAGHLDRLNADGEDGAHAALRLQQVEERLALFARLERKHGGSIAEVLAHAEHCRRRMGELRGAESTLERVEGELAAARSELLALAARLGARRREVAPRLASAVTARLADLAMPEATLEVEISPRPGGPGPTGADMVELRIATHPGARPQPLREVASGGELSRVMLALLSVAHGGAEEAEAAERPLLVFDEIDAGIGGHTAHAVGEHLKELARGRQVLCITHLPQVAALAQRHFTIAKDPSSCPGRTAVRMLEAETVVGELVRMMGASDGDRAAAEHARHLLRAAA